MSEISQPGPVKEVHSRILPGIKGNVQIRLEEGVEIPEIPLISIKMGLDDRGVTRVRLAWDTDDGNGGQAFLLEDGSRFKGAPPEVLDRLRKLVKMLPESVTSTE